jgi:hypothetical protein
MRVCLHSSLSRERAGGEAAFYLPLTPSNSLNQMNDDTLIINALQKGNYRGSVIMF